MDFEKLLSDMSFNSSFRLLEEGKDSAKLMEIAKSSGLVLPAHDISVFECVYAFTDRQNKNGCTLPKAEVEKALATLKGKSIDLDHNRKTVVGYWIEGRLVENQIIAYGAIWKGSFEQDFDIIKELFSKGNLNVSFEAWGNRVQNKTGYDLTDIEFAGGALLIKTEPAFDGASVLEMAKTRVLELASVMKANTPKTFVREYGTEDLSSYENFTGTDEEFDNMIAAEEEAIPLTFTAEDLQSPVTAAKLSYQQRKAIPDEHFAVVKTVKGKTIRKFPIADENHVRNALARLPQATESLSKLGVSPASVKAKIMKRAKALKMTSLVNRHSDDGSTDYVGANIEHARMYVSDMDHIMRNLQEVDCPSCNADSMLDPTYIDYGNNQMKVNCANCGSEFKVDMQPAVSLTKKGRKIKAINQYVQKPGKSVSDMATFINDPDLSGERVELALEEVLVGLPKLDNAARFELTDEDFAIVKNVEVEKGKNKKIRVLPIPDLAHIHLARILLEQSNTTELLNQLSISKDTVDRKITRKVVTLAMKNLMKKYNVATAVEAIQALSKEKIGREMTDEELERAYSIVSLRDGTTTRSAQTAPGQPGYSITGMPKGKSAWNDTSVIDVTLSDNEYNSLVEKATKKDDEMEKAELQKKLDEATAKLTEVTTKLAAYDAEKAAAEATKKADLVKARRTELTEAFAKDLKDEDILDETKFELAKMKKENAELKSGKKTPVKATVVDLSKGAVKDDTTTTTTAAGDLTLEQASRKKVDEMAWASRNRKSASDQSDE